MARVSYNAAYFIKFFSRIPASKWCVDKWKTPDGRCCALGHCGETANNVTPEKAQALTDLFYDYLNSSAARVNDDTSYGTGPRARILSALRAIQAKGG